MAVERFVELVHQVETLGLRGLQITGGEFFVWRPHMAVLPLLAELTVPTSISTNGSHVDAQKLAHLHRSQVSLSLSLDGPAAVHDAMRGSDTHALTLRAAEQCARLGVQFFISSTVTKKSLPHVATTTRQAAEAGARAIYFSPIQRLGGRSEDIDAQRLSDDECVELLAALTLLRDKVPAGFTVNTQAMGMRPTAVKNPCSVFACWGEFCPSKKHWPSKLFVMPDGEVLPQSLHIHRNYSLGNAFAEGFDKLVERYWGSAKHAQFQSLSRHVYQDLIFGADDPFFFWDELAQRASARPPAELPAHKTVSHPHDHSEEIEQAHRRGRLPVIQFPIRQ